MTISRDHSWINTGWNWIEASGNDVRNSATRPSSPKISVFDFQFQDSPDSPL